MATLCRVFVITLLFLENVFCKEVVSDPGRVGSHHTETESTINKRGIPFKRLPGWSVYYGKRSPEVERISKRGSPSNDAAPSGDYLSAENGNDKSEGRKYDNNYRVELQNLLSSFDHSGSYNVNGQSDVIGAVKDTGTKTGVPWMSADDTLNDDILDHIDTIDTSEDGNIATIDNRFDLNDLIKHDNGYPLEDGGQPETLIPFKDGDVDKRSGWSAIYGKRMPGWFATYGKRFSALNSVYQRRAPAWSVTYGKRAPAWQALYGKRAPGWQAGYGKRGGAWQAVYGKRAPGWQAGYGKRAPGWQAGYGKRVPGWQAGYGKRAPGWQAGYGKRAPGWQAGYGKRAPGWQAGYGKRAPGWQAGYGKRAPGWQAGYGKRAPAWQATYGKRLNEDWQQISDQDDIDQTAQYNKRAPAWHVTYGKRAPAWQATYGKKAAWITTYGKRAPAWSVTYGKRYPAWQSTYGKRDFDSDSMDDTHDDTGNAREDDGMDSKHSFNSEQFQSSELPRTL